MKSIPKISILCSVYNREKYISATIQSIIAQSYANYELLIVDDGSSDCSLDIVHALSEEHDNIKYWTSSNKGIIYQYNFLLSQTSADSSYITWIDSDDLYSSNNLELRADIILKNPEVSMIYNGLQFINEEDNPIEMMHNKEEDIFFGYKMQKIDIYGFLTNFLSKNYDLPISYGSLLIRKDVLQSVGVINPTRNDRFFIGDFDLFLRISAKYFVYGYSEKILLYRKHSQQITQIQTRQMFLDVLDIMKYLYDKSFISKKGLKEILSILKNKEL